MNSKLITVLAIIASTCIAFSAVQAAEAIDKSYSETQAESSVSWGEIDPSKAITAYDYRAMMLRSVGEIMKCHRCSPPCNAYACCNDMDGYLQCCLDNNGRCMCCHV